MAFFHRSKGLLVNKAMIVSWFLELWRRLVPWSKLLVKQVRMEFCEYDPDSSLVFKPFSLFCKNYFLKHFFVGGAMGLVTATGTTAATVCCKFSNISCYHDLNGIDECEWFQLKQYHFEWNSLRMDLKSWTQQMHPERWLAKELNFDTYKILVKSTTYIFSKQVLGFSLSATYLMQCVKMALRMNFSAVCPLIEKKPLKASIFNVL